MLEIGSPSLYSSGWLQIYYFVAHSCWPQNHHPPAWVYWALKLQIHVTSGIQYLFKNIYFYSIYFSIYLHACVPYTCLVPEEIRKGCRNPQDLELQMVVSYCMGSGTWTWSSVREVCTYFCAITRHQHFKIKVSPLKSPDSHCSHSVYTKARCYAFSQLYWVRKCERRWDTMW